MSNICGDNGSLHHRDRHHGSPLHHFRLRDRRTRARPRSHTGGQLPAELAAVNNVSASAASANLWVQLLGTAFSDPTVNRVEEITVGEFGSVCGFMEAPPECVTLTREQFFSEP